MISLQQSSFCIIIIMIVIIIIMCDTFMELLERRVMTSRNDVRARGGRARDRACAVIALVY